MRPLGESVLILVAAATPLFGQRSGLREARNGGSAGVTLAIAEPLGDFRRSASVGAGLTLFGVAPLSRRGGVGLRFEGAYIIYDSDYQGYGLSTTSQIGTLAMGPQVTIGGGPLNLYTFLTYGGSLFWSSASSDGYCGCYDRDAFYLGGDFTTTTQLGTGIQIRVSRRRRAVAIDLGIRDTRHAMVTYVPAGAFTDNGDGTYTVRQVETPVNLRVFQMGVSVGLR